MPPTPDPVVTASGRGRVAALTLDDGPDGEATLALLDLFRRTIGCGRRSVSSATRCWLPEAPRCCAGPSPRGTTSRPTR